MSTVASEIAEKRIGSELDVNGADLASAARIALVIGLAPAFGAAPAPDNAMGQSSSAP